MRKTIINFFIIYLLIAEGCYLTKPNRPDYLRGFERDSLKIFQEGTNYISTTASDKINLMIFDRFDDTMRIYINNRIAWQGYINEANNPSTSSGYSGVTINIDSKKQIKKVTIALLKQRKYVEFQIEKYYPLYTLQRFDDIWYINGRGAPPTLK